MHHKIYASHIMCPTRSGFQTGHQSLGNVTGPSCPSHNKDLSFAFPGAVQDAVHNYDFKQVLLCCLNLPVKSYHVHFPSHSQTQLQRGELNKFCCVRQWKASLLSAGEDGVPQEKSRKAGSVNIHQTEEEVTEL